VYIMQNIQSIDTVSIILCCSNSKNRLEKQEHNRFIS